VAAVANRSTIERRLAETREWMQVPEHYQSANRLAFLHFLRGHEVAASLVNLCFVDDPDIRTTRAALRTSIWTPVRHGEEARQVVEMFVR
jgi:hypothetical protein